MKGKKMTIPKDSYDLICKYISDIKSIAATRKSFAVSVVARREAQAQYDVACLFENFLKAFAVA